MSKGLAVTWNNPDIQLFDGPNPVPSNNIGTKKKYSIRAQIWNGSVDAPVVNLLVRFYYLSFGAGTIKHYIGQKFVDVPVKGAGGLPAIVEHATLVKAVVLAINVVIVAYLIYFRWSSSTGKSTRSVPPSDGACLQSEQGPV